jgi:hypothetical protein
MISLHIPPPTAVIAASQVASVCKLITADTVPKTAEVTSGRTTGSYFSIFL